MDMLKRFLKKEEGTSMVEWGLLAALIVIVCIGAMGLIGTNLNAKFAAIAAAL